MPNPDVPLAVGTTLPLVGYTPDQLKDWIFRQLGSPIWHVELDIQHVLDSIQEALRDSRDRWTELDLRARANSSIIRDAFSWEKCADRVVNLLHSQGLLK